MAHRELELTSRPERDTGNLDTSVSTLVIPHYKMRTYLSPIVELHGWYERVLRHCTSISGEDGRWEQGAVERRHIRARGRV